MWKASSSVAALLTCTSCTIAAGAGVTRSSTTDELLRTAKLYSILETPVAFAPGSSLRAEFARSDGTSELWRTGLLIGYGRPPPVYERLGWELSAGGGLRRAWDGASTAATGYLQGSASLLIRAGATEPPWMHDSLLLESLLVAIEAGFAGYPQPRQSLNGEGFMGVSLRWRLHTGVKP